MAATDDGQAAAIPNANNDRKAIGATGAVAVPVAPTSIQVTETFVSGTAKQLTAGALSARYLYLNVTTSAALAIAWGPDSTTALTFMASESAALGMISLRVPAGWYVKITGTIADISTISTSALY